MDFLEVKTITRNFVSNPFHLPTRKNRGSTENVMPVVKAIFPRLNFRENLGWLWVLFVYVLSYSSIFFH